MNLAVTNTFSAIKCFHFLSGHFPLGYQENNDEVIRKYFYLDHI